LDTINLDRTTTSIIWPRCVQCWAQLRKKCTNYVLNQIPNYLWNPGKALTKEKIMCWIKSLIISVIPGRRSFLSPLPSLRYLLSQAPGIALSHPNLCASGQTCPRSLANSTPTTHFSLSRAAPRWPPTMPHIAYVISAAMPPPAGAPISSMRSSWSIPEAGRAHHRERMTMANWRQKSTHGICAAPMALSTTQLVARTEATCTTLAALKIVHFSALDRLHRGSLDCVLFLCPRRRVTPPFWMHFQTRIQNWKKNEKPSHLVILCDMFSTKNIKLVILQTFWKSVHKISYHEQRFMTFKPKWPMQSQWTQHSLFKWSYIMQYCATWNDYQCCHREFSF
jgi:hypothetical protein